MHQFRMAARESAKSPDPKGFGSVRYQLMLPVAKNSVNAPGVTEYDLECQARLMDADLVKGPDYGTVLLTMPINDKTRQYHIQNAINMES